MLPGWPCFQSYPLLHAKDVADIRVPVISATTPEDDERPSVTEAWVGHFEIPGDRLPFLHFHNQKLLI